MYYFSINGNFLSSLKENDNYNSTLFGDNKMINHSNDLGEAIANVYDATVMVNNYQNEKVVSTGSGFIYRTDDKYGYILTNHHVIAKAKKVTVYMSDDKEVDATVLGNDQYLDLAVLRIAKKDVKKVATIGKNSECRLGDTVFSIGSPIGYEFRGTVTNGIISGLNRLVEVSVSGGGDDWVMEVLQTNTAVNPGNSGGPLCNSKGEIIGVVSLKLVEDAVEGMGFAIPIEYAMSHIDVLEKGEKITRPLLGISMLNATATETLKKNYDINVDRKITKGVVVVEISKDTGASKSSLKKGDVITQIDGKNANNIAYLKYLLYKYSPGDIIELTYYRNGEYRKTKITLTKNNE